jgi:calcineurin-like phosphoesterase family protein
VAAFDGKLSEDRQLRTIFFISDTHWGHAEFLDNRKRGGGRIRPFSSVDEMDETMIERWNERVREDDIVYHLGDVFFGKPDGFHAIMRRLKGRKRLVMGNHDDMGIGVYRRYFQKIMSWRMFKSDVTGTGQTYIACHYPLHPCTVGYDAAYSIEDRRFCVHGHIHDKRVKDPGYINVCVEQIDFRPVAMEELTGLARSQGALR